MGRAAAHHLGRLDPAREGEIAIGAALRRADAQTLSGLQQMRRIPAQLLTAESDPHGRAGQGNARGRGDFKRAAKARHLDGRQRLTMPQKGGGFIERDRIGSTSARQAQMGQPRAPEVLHRQAGAGFMNHKLCHRRTSSRAPPAGSPADKSADISAPETGTSRISSPARSGIGVSLSGRKGRKAVRAT